MYSTPAKQKLPLKELFAKKLRGFKRGTRAFLDGGTQLTHEKHEAVVKGQPGDLKAMRGLDLQIGAMIAPYDGSQRVPDKVSAEIDRHIRDLREVFTRVGAVQPAAASVTVQFVTVGDVAELFSGQTPPKTPAETPLRELEFVSHYKSNAGTDIEQRLAKFTLGRGF
jgi:hypothetical protein